MSSSQSSNSEVENEDFLPTESESKPKLETDESSINSLEILKTVMEPSSGSHNESSGSSSKDGHSPSPSISNSKRRFISERPRRQSRSERNRKYGRSRSMDQSRSPRNVRTRFRSRGRRQSRFPHRTSPRLISPRRERFRRRSRSPPRFCRFNTSRSRSPVLRRKSPKSRSRVCPPLRSFSPTGRPTSTSFIDKSGGDDHRPQAHPGFDSSHRYDQDIEGPTDAENGQGSGSSKSIHEGSLEINRCRDFEEQGVCLRGELCPFDHGKDPVVLEDVVPSDGPPSVNTMPNYVPRGCMLRPRMGYSSFSNGRPMMTHGNDEYFPENPSMEAPTGWNHTPHQFRPRPLPFGFMNRGRGGLFFRPQGLPPFPVPPGQRQLVSVPLASPYHPQMGGKFTAGRGHGRPFVFDHTRLGFPPVYGPSPKMIRNRLNCSLEVRKIPREQNNILALNNHFSQFGKITNIQINYENDPEAAVVTFHSPGEAQNAYRSSEAVLNNRFIKVYWHPHSGGEYMKEGDEGNGASNPLSSGPASEYDQPPRIPVKERLGFLPGYPGPHNQYEVNMGLPGLHPTVSGSTGGQEGSQVGSNFHEGISGNCASACVNTVAAKKLKAMAMQQDSANSSEAIVKNQSQETKTSPIQLQFHTEEQKKLEALKMTNELRRRLQTMMEEQISNQKRLIAKLESGKLKPEEREETFKVLKTLQESVDKLTKEICSTNAKVIELQNQKPSPPVRFKTKDEIKKEILDAELDLFMKDEGKNANPAESIMYSMNITYEK